jgi:hypothetical protein
VVITSGGTMLEMAKAKGLDHIVIPGGNPPRTMLAYSLVQQFFVLHHFGIIGDGFEGRHQDRGEHVGATTRRTSRRPPWSSPRSSWASGW